MKKSALYALVALAPLAFAGQVMAQEGEDQNVPTVSSELVVQAEIVYRNRSEQVAPVLEYGQDYFQRFEPLTAGDALKRVPSVQFLSDVLESDGARLRGLDPGYTQILIDGERVPGGQADRSFFVDRIPAELIDRIEVVRSSSANRSGDAVAGALNIVLRDAYALDGGYIRVGALAFDDKRIRETLGGVYSTEVGPGRLLVGANVQGRRNPKRKFSARYNQPGGTLDNVELQTDTRNGTDYSLNASYQTPFLGGDLDLSGLYVRTDRYANEDSIEYRNGLLNNANRLTNNDNNVDIETDNWSVNSKFTREMLGGETKVKLGYARFTDTQEEVEEEYEFLRDAIAFPEDDRFTGDLTFTDIEDSEISAALEHKRELAGFDIEFGVQYVKKDRETLITEDRNRVTIPNAPAPRPVLPGVYGPFVAVAGGDNTIEETRIDPYAMVSGKTGAFKWEAGLRFETTDVDIDDRTAGASSSKDYSFLLPSASLKWSLTPVDRISVSAARTVRRPNFNFISPALLEAEYGDNDFLGNPDLDPETAIGFDIGYERRLGRQGVAGINVFYRDVKDLIEISNTGTVGSEGAGTFVLTARNAGDGKVYGVELDLSTPLTVFDMPNTGVFLNYSWLDSEIDDEFGSRTFNDQSDFILNVGFIQDLPEYAAAFGATYRKQGDAQGRIVGEEVTTEYSADLEIFVEKRLGKNLTIRFIGSNLLNATKREVFNKFTTIADQQARNFDEFELESEEAGPVYQLIARMAF